MTTESQAIDPATLPNIRDIDTLINAVCSNKTDFGKEEVANLVAYFERGTKLLSTSLIKENLQPHIFGLMLTDAKWWSRNVDLKEGMKAVFAARIADSASKTGPGLFNSFQVLYGGHGSRKLFESIQAEVSAKYPAK